MKLIDGVPSFRDMPIPTYQYRVAHEQSIYIDREHVRIFYVISFSDNSDRGFRRHRSFISSPWGIESSKLTRHSFPSLKSNRATSN